VGEAPLLRNRGVHLVAGEFAVRRPISVEFVRW
jgi:hypothetical protein